MNPIEMLEQEHEEIERELIELDTICHSETINYSNLAHTFKRLVLLWNPHEKKEERIFSVMKKESVVVPVRKMLMEHQELRSHKELIMKAIESGTGIRDALDKHCRIVIEKLRKHIKDEDQILYTIVLSEFSESEIEEMARVLV